MMEKTRDQIIAGTPLPESKVVYQFQMKSMLLLNVWHDIMNQEMLDAVRARPDEYALRAMVSADTLMRAPVATVASVRADLAEVGCAQRENEEAGKPSAPVHQATDELRAFLEEMSQSGKEMNGSYWIPRAVKLLADWPEVSPPLSEGLTDELGECACLAESLRFILLNAKDYQAWDVADEARAALQVVAALSSRLSSPPSPTLHGVVGAEWECLDRFEQWAEDEGHGIGPRSEWANNRSSTGFLMWIGWQGVARKIDATPVSTQSGAAAAQVDRNAVLEECRAVFDLMLDGCNDDKFGDFQNGHGEEIGPRMDALHAKLRAMSPVSAPDGGDDRKETGDA